MLDHPTVYLRSYLRLDRSLYLLPLSGSGLSLRRGSCVAFLYIRFRRSLDDRSSARSIQCWAVRSVTLVSVWSSEESARSPLRVCKVDLLLDDLHCLRHGPGCFPGLAGAQFNRVYVRHHEAVTFVALLLLLRPSRFIPDTVQVPICLNSRCRPRLLWIVTGQVMWEDSKLYFMFKLGAIRRCVFFMAAVSNRQPLSVVANVYTLPVLWKCSKTLVGACVG